MCFIICMYVIIIFNTIQHMDWLGIVSKVFSFKLLKIWASEVLLVKFFIWNYSKSDFSCTYEILLNDLFFSEKIPFVKCWNLTCSLWTMCIIKHFEKCCHFLRLTYWPSVMLFYPSSELPVTCKIYMCNFFFFFFFSNL